MPYRSPTTREQAADALLDVWQKVAAMSDARQKLLDRHTYN